MAIVVVLATVLVSQLPVATSAADQVVLRDGRTVLGQVVDAAPRKPLRVAVSRAWVRKHLPDRAAIWEQLEALAASKGRAQRLRRLEAWQLQRQPDPQDRIGAWLATQIARLQGGGGTPAPLMIVEIASAQVRRVERRSEEARRVLRQAWKAGLEEPEGRTVEDLRRILEGRGVALGEVDPADVADLLAIPLETDAIWLARRGATEVLNDRGLRFIRYQGLVLPEDAATGPGNLLGAATTALKGLLGEEPTDEPLENVLRTIEATGRVGAVLTRLEIGDDLASSTVESTLLVRLGPERWVPAASRPATVQAAAVAPEAVDPVANDPQVQGIFRMFEGLGLGAAGQDAQRRSLSVGAATKQALGLSQTALRRDLEAFALPVGR